MFLNSKNTYNIFSVILFILITCKCFYYASTLVIWMDELNWTLLTVDNQNIFEILQTLAVQAYNLPLFYLILKLFYSISDNLIWLRSISILFTLCGIGLLYKFISENYGKSYSVLMLFLILFTDIYINLAANIRPYGLLFLLSVATIYFYNKRNKNENWKNIIIYGAIITLFAYTHWYAALCILAYSLSDLYLWLRKKIAFKCIVSYLICAFTFIPWLFFVYINHKTDVSVYWGKDTSYLYLLRIIYQISSIITFSLFFISFNYFIFTYKKANCLIKQNFFVIFLVYTISWLYAQFNPNGSVFVIRYFFIILPHILLFCIGNIKSIIDNKTYLTIYSLITDKLINSVLCAIALILAYITFSYTLSGYTSPAENRNYEKTIEIIQQEETPTLLLTYYKRFWKYIINDTPDFDIMYIDTHDNYTVFGKLNPKLALKYDHCLKHHTCQDAQVCYDLAINLHKDFSAQQTTYPLNKLCSYDTIYLLILDSPLFLYAFLKQYFDAEIIMDTSDSLIKFTKKRQSD